ncbi:DUF2254 domain-containing protein [Paraglaciecola sp. 2405UD69-4]|uniref:DUF2254 domain-containing protein n=1 Tax=Paraglaciecola sp. 2405UD69-4 TaxID=3391836 RepID=UPI0039C8C584
MLSTCLSIDTPKNRFEIILKITKFASTIEKIRANFWFVPSLMVGMFLMVAILAVYIDYHRLLPSFSFTNLLYKTDTAVIQSLLGTMAAAMITVTSIAFSITIVSLTLASSQFGPRLMRNFMMDKSTQFVLGTFTSTFLFCLFIYCTLSFKDPYAYQPGLTILIAVLLTCFSVGVLIFFIHHVAKSIQAENVINDVYLELNERVDQLFPNSQQTEPSNGNCAPIELHDYNWEFEATAQDNGYIQIIVIDNLKELAEKLDLLIELHFVAGDFVVKGQVLATAYGKDIHTKTTQNIEPDLLSSIEMGPARTPSQDPVFAIHQLVEIALRALSPGINDPYTAITCVEKLNAILCRLCTESFPVSQLQDAKGVVRIKRKVLTFTDLAGAAYDQIRQNSQQNVAVTLTIIKTLTALMTFTKNPSQIEFVKGQCLLLMAQQKETKFVGADKTLIDDRLKYLQSLIMV